MTRRELILATITDGVTALMYYGRKEDEELPVDAIEEAVAAGEITKDDMVDAFRKALGEYL